MNIHPLAPFAIGVAAGLVICLSVVLSSGPSQKQKSFDWAVRFCGGQEKDIQSYMYISGGIVTCQDGRRVTVPE